MKGYLLDTNHLGVILKAKSPLHARMLSARLAGKRFGTCVPVLCELAAGMAQTASRDKNWRALSALLRLVRVWPMDLEAVRAYGDVYGELRAKGRVLSQVDIMVAALARRADLVVLTTDADFRAVDGLKTENWLDAPKS